MTLLGLFNSPRAGMRPYARKGVKRHDNHIKSKSYKLELLEEFGRLTVLKLECF